MIKDSGDLCVAFCSVNKTVYIKHETHGLLGINCYCKEVKPERIP